MSFYVAPPRPARRNKLGLALAGGGFRASLFHLGVLRRMAEMDLLRHVEVLSTVSGGSIVAALYILMLKQRLDANAQLSRDGYVALTRALEEAFVAGVQKNLRTRLILNPLGMLSVMLCHDSLSARMGRIYQRYLFRGTVDALRTQDPNLPNGTALSRWLWPGWIPMRSVHFRPGGQEVTGGIDGYNRGVLSAPQPGSAIPNFIINATALNSGAPFRFSSVEIGDPRLGYFRYEEADIINARKDLLERPLDELRAILNGQAPLPSVKGIQLGPQAVTLALWWRTRAAAQPELPPQFGQWTRVFAPNVASAGEALGDTNFGRLRQLKLPAWYVSIGPWLGVGGGATQDEHLARFNQVLRQVDPTVPEAVIGSVAAQDALGSELIDFAIELYYLRSAQAMSPHLRDDFDAISLATAVAASANFPPVFPPLTLLGFYDDLHVTRLGLSDGGVYDNLGIITLLDEGCTHIIASDTGAPFDVKQRVGARHIEMVSRLPAVLTDDVAEQQHTILRERRRVSDRLDSYGGPDQAVLDLKDEYGLKALAFFSIDSVDPPGGGGIDLGFDREAVARLRTDLDAFGDLEVAALINTGYDRADRFLHAYFPGPPHGPVNQHWNSARAAPRPIAAQHIDRTRRVLKVGQSRLFRALRLWSIPSWIFTIAVIVAILFSYGGKLVSVQSMVNGIPTFILSRLERPFPLLPDSFNRWVGRMVNRQVSLGVLLLVATGLALLVFKGWPWLVDRFSQSRAAGTRRAVTATKWVRAFAPALLLFVGLAPLWVAAGACAIGAVSYFAYNKPFLRKTRMG